MKTSTKNKRFNLLSIFRQNGPINSIVSVILALAIINLNYGCSYYRVADYTTTPEEFDTQMQKFNNKGYYAIVHSEDKVFHLKNLKIDRDSNTISGTSKTLEPRHAYFKKRKKSGNRFNSRHQDPTSELHIILKTKIAPEHGTDLNIPLSDIQSVSINKRDGATEFGIFMLAAAGFLGVVVLLVAALKSSCPFVYVKKGDTYQFVGELYPGVITENMQRDDFIPLGKFDGNQLDYSLKVTNELKEIQHTDILELIVVDHNKDTEVLLDDSGEVHTFTDLITSKDIVMDGTKGDESILNKMDGQPYAFNSISSANNDKRHVILEFEVPENQKDAKLFMTAKNSMWLDYIFGKFNEKIGVYYKDYQAKQQQAKKERSERWTKEQYIPLSVYVETPEGWQFIKEVNTVGPLAYRDIVVPIDSEFITQNKLKVKLETGFMFWEVDYVAIDYSENLPVTVNHTLPKSAIDHNNVDVTNVVSFEDKTYLTQANIGDAVTVNFKLDSTISSDYKTVFLKNRGYYNYIRDYKGKPDLASLKIFSKEGSFTKFSKLEYYAIMGYDHDKFTPVKNESTNTDIRP